MIQAIFTLGLGALFWEAASTQIKSLQDSISSRQKMLLLLVAHVGVSIPFFLRDPIFPQVSPLLLLFVTLKIVGSIAVTYFATKTIENVDRSTNAQYSILLIPILLCTDRIMGYISGWRQLIGGMLIVLRFARSLYKNKLSHKGLHYVLITMWLSATNTILFKYLIYNFWVDAYFLNGILACGSFLAVGIYLLYSHGRTYVKYPFQKKYLVFALCDGIASTLGASTFTVLPPSLIVASKRVRYLIFGTLSWAYYFHEKHLRQKYINVWLLVGCVWIMQLPVILSLSNSTSMAQFFKTDIAGVSVYQSLDTSHDTRKDFVPYMYY